MLACCRAVGGLLLLTALSGPLCAADVFKGKTVFETYCEICHGDNGQGQIPGTPNFTRGERLIQSDVSLFESISAGRNAMPGFRGILTENEILDAITYIRTFH
jgi:mono/diheme cytochrome c family protein